MKKYIVLQLSLYIINICQAQALSSDTLFWSNNRLTGADFQQNDQDDKPVPFVAKSRWLLYFKIVPSTENTSLKVPIVRAVFFPKFSWIKHRAQGNENVLRHEQLHFDIVELHARKLRRLLDLLEIVTRKDQKRAVGYAWGINSQLFEMQKQYDWETSHGSDRAKQVWWVTYIFLQLRELEKYALFN
ncbi:MAG: hypothetical protein Q8L07_13175 [Sediminibacterium sp.]|nr:hypothetical protein [Sediminibacterium sp.]